MHRNTTHPGGLMVIVFPLPTSGFVLNLFRAGFVVLALVLVWMFVGNFFGAYVNVWRSNVLWMAAPMIGLTGVTLWLAFKRKVWLASGALALLVCTNLFIQHSWQSSLNVADSLNQRAASYVEAALSSFRGHHALVPEAVQSFAWSLETISSTTYESVPEAQERATNHGVIYGDVNDLGVGNRIAWPDGTGSEGFLAAYEPLRQQYGDWLGLVADCELGLDPKVVAGGLCSSAEGILESYGVDLREQMRALMADHGGMTACTSQMVCASYAQRYRDFLR